MCKTYWNNLEILINNESFLENVLNGYYSQQNDGFYS